MEIRTSFGNTVKKITFIACFVIFGDAIDAACIDIGRLERT